MKRYISLILIICMMNLMFVGCGEQSSPDVDLSTNSEAIVECRSASRIAGNIEPTLPFEKNYSVGSVNVQSIINDTTNQEISVLMEFIDEDGVLQKQTLLFANNGTNETHIGISVSLSESENLLWMNELAHEIGSNTFHFKELTQIDGMEIEITSNNGSTTEIYKTQNEELAVNYTDEEFEILEHLVNLTPNTAAQKISPSMQRRMNHLKAGLNELGDMAI